MDSSHCPLCASKECIFYHRDNKRDYWQCPNCALVHVPAEFSLSPTLEKAQYDHHQNDPEDIYYRKFLSRTTAPLFERMNSNSVGLDFGCGPGPTICHMAAEVDIRVDNYDLYYHPDKTTLKQTYDFVCLTEVIEHIAQPMALLQQLNQLLKPGATLALMTKRTTDLACFKNWHYKNDPTHISFFHLDSFQWLGQKMNWKLEVIDQDVVFFTKPQAPIPS